MKYITIVVLVLMILGGIGYYFSHQKSSVMKKTELKQVAEDLQSSAGE